MQADNKFLTRCHNLWMWTDKELEELQDEALAKRAKKWRNEIHMLASNIAPKLVKSGVFPDGGISVNDLVSLPALYNSYTWLLQYFCMFCFFFRKKEFVLLNQIALISLVHQVNQSGLLYL